MTLLLGTGTPINYVNVVWGLVGRDDLKKYIAIFINHTLITLYYRYLVCMPVLCNMKLKNYDE